MKIPESIVMNQHQPNRPLYGEYGDILLYRTRPSRPNYRVCDWRNMVCQMTLYRYATSPHWTQGTSIEELHDYLLGGFNISKNWLGQTILQTVRYDPRKLIAPNRMNKNDRVVKAYVIHHREEMVYGLEWMICTWLRNFLNDQSAPGEQPIFGPNMMLSELDILSTSDEKEFREIYLNPIRQQLWKMKEPDWAALLRLHGPEHDIPELYDQEVVKVPPRPMWNGAVKTEVKRDVF